MKKLLALLTFAVMTVSVQAQTVYYRGSTGNGYMDKKTMYERETRYKHLINDKSWDVTLESKNGKKAWFASVGGKHFMGWFDESLTMTEKNYIQKQRKLNQKKTQQKKTNSNNEAPNPFSSDVISVTTVSR